MIGPALDFGYRGLRMLVGDDDRAAQAAFLLQASWRAAQAVGGRPPSRRRGNRDCAGLLARASSGIRTPYCHPHRVEVLLAHEVEIRAGRAAGRRPRASAVARWRVPLRRYWMSVWNSGSRELSPILDQMVAAQLFFEERFVVTASERQGLDGYRNQMIS